MQRIAKALGAAAIMAAMFLGTTHAEDVVAPLTQETAVQATETAATVTEDVEAAIAAANVEAAQAAQGTRVVAETAAVKAEPAVTEELTIDSTPAVTSTVMRYADNPCMLTACYEAVECFSPSEFSLGAVATVTISPYKQYDTTVMPFPYISYKGQHFFINGDSAGVYVVKNDRHELTVGAAYLGMEFRPRHTDNATLKLLDKRLSTALAEINYSYISKIGLIRARVAQDVLGKSNGTLANLSIHVPWITDRFILMPGLGVEFASKNHNKYYYGVRGDEAARSPNLRRDDTGHTFTPYATLEAKFSINERWDIVAKGRIDYLASKVCDSQMVGKNYAASFTAGFQYNF
ncbi:MAG: MipA/OmpV family protein [Planctomycetaceae bacterium]|nr:MipA/OmpV family protein [Planctomycetaceae bacterium]